MTAKHALLPREVSALVHHIELNRAGWWEKALNRLVLAAIWLSDGNPDVAEIRVTFEGTFSLPISADSDLPYGRWAREPLTARLPRP
jgi:hypothetical protein